ncbi:MAG: TIGR02584 family CRISPR-associated protein [Zetaproteobacteria bacterium]|nr:MAG: TIGR02584 family CRISPR-associated protein [Zetaproteobacteria bacterium]
MKKILIAVSGLSPQILTETLYALARRGAFIPDEVHLITTSEGAERARLLLLSEDPGWYYRLCRDYHLPEGAFTADRIHLLRDASGAPLADIRTPEDNGAAADSILAVVRRLSADPECAIHASIAGGRKTMGFYMGYAMSLYGRPQDALSHVLVAQPFESLPDFFYPTRERTIIYTRDGKPLDAATARIWLADIPFVRMRSGIPDALRDETLSFSAVVAAASRAFHAPQLELDPVSRTLSTPIGCCMLPPIDFAFYLWLARLRAGGSEGIAAPPEGVAEADYGRAVLDCYREVHNFSLRGHDRTEEALMGGMQKSFFEQRKSRVNKAIRLALGVQDSPYEIARAGRPGHFRFGLLRLDPAAILLP